MSCLILNITKKTSENKIDQRGTKKNVLIDHGKEYIMVAELGNRTLDGDMRINKTGVHINFITHTLKA